MSNTPTPKCKKCHKNTVARRGQVCPNCKRNSGGGNAQPRAFRDMTRVLTHSAPMTANGASRGRLITTADVLALVGVRMHTASKEQFQRAAMLAGLFTDWLSGRPLDWNS